MTVEIPRRQIGWQSWFTATGPHMAPKLCAVWQPCPTCWSQRFIVEVVQGHHYRTTCSKCLGLGEIVKLLDVGDA